MGRILAPTMKNVATLPQVHHKSLKLRLRTSQTREWGLMPDPSYGIYAKVLQIMKLCMRSVSLGPLTEVIVSRLE